MVGLFIGLPAGCYLREAGYHHRALRAYHVLVPKSEAPKSDGFRNSAEEYHENMMQGKADVKDFERYIYGDSYNS